MKKTLFFVGILCIILIASFTFKVTHAITLENPLKAGSITELISTIGSLLQVAAVAVGVVMIIVAGIQYITSAGNEDKAKKAKQMIIYTLIGVAIVTAANFIVQIVTELLGKIN